MRDLRAPSWTSLSLRRRWTSTVAADGPQDVAIIGGGISGLSAAYFAAKELPETRITVYDASDRLGGWLSSRRVEVPGGSIVVETGPRTLMTDYKGAATALLVCLCSDTRSLAVAARIRSTDSMTRAHHRSRNSAWRRRCSSCRGTTHPWRASSTIRTG